MSRTAPRRETRRARREHARSEAPRPRPRPRISALQVVGVSVIAVAAVIGFIWMGSAQSASPASTLSPSIAQSGHVRGVASAPVTIEEWADFQCPACGQFARVTEPQLFSSYVANGQVSIVFHHFAFLGQESSGAAEAAECASEQGKFFEYHDKLFSSQAGENRGAFSKDNLKKFGSDLGLDSSFNACVDSGRYAQAVRDDTKIGQGRGVSATPTLFVNGRKIEGAASFEQLRTIIEPLLAGR